MIFIWHFIHIQEVLWCFDVNCKLCCCSRKFLTLPTLNLANYVWYGRYRATNRIPRCLEFPYNIFSSLVTNINFPCTKTLRLNFRSSHVICAMILHLRLVIRSTMQILEWYFNLLTIALMLQEKHKRLYLKIHISPTILNPKIKHTQHSLIHSNIPH